MRIQQAFDRVFVKKYLRHQSVGRILHRFPILRRIVSRLSSTLLSLQNSALRYEKRSNFGRVRDRGQVGEHGYTDKYGDLSAALGYAKGIAAPDFGENQLGESYVLYREQIKTLSELIERAGIEKVFNFGICYAYVDSVLARKFGDVEFSGIDLSPHNAAFNAVEFGDVRNLRVLCGDAFRHLADNDCRGRGVFFHSRTLVLLPKDFIERLYRAAHAAGFEYVVGFEQSGLSEETLEPYTFDLSDKESVYWRDRMYIHNYPGIAEKCGFRVESADLFATKHTSPDFRVLRFVAKRTDA